VLADGHADFEEGEDCCGHFQAFFCSRALTGERGIRGESNGCRRAVYSVAHGYVCVEGLEMVMFVWRAGAGDFNRGVHGT
jgi:hypothetical protein